MSSSYELEKSIRSMIRSGMDEMSIIRSLSGSDSVKDPMLIEEAVQRVCDDYPDYGLIQFFMNSKIAVDRRGEDDVLYLYNPKVRCIKTIDKSRLNDMISSKLDWSFRRYTCNFSYEPTIPFVIKKLNGDWTYNTYNPPKWQEDYFYSEGAISIPKVESIPPIYEKFLKHLVAGHEGSYNYILDWLANSLQNRNYCILATIGNQGIGKGVLGEIMMELVGGEINFSSTDKKVLTKDFNGQMKDKRIVYLDEIKVTNTDQENKLKSMVNNFIEVEKKGVDASLVKNYSSIYYSSNNLDSIRITDDDRRFSIVELTSKKLVEFMSTDEIKTLKIPENIEEFARYLWYRKIDSEKMMRPFRTSRTELIRSSSLADWQEWFLDEYAPTKAGKTIPVKEVSVDVKDEHDMSRGPGRNKFLELSDLYPAIFKVKKLSYKDKQVWCIVFENN